MEIKYVSSNGKEYNLIGDKMRATAGGFHNYKWDVKSKEAEFGEEVYGFKKGSITYDITLSIRGTLEERKAYLDELRNAFEYDVLRESPGTIYFGKYYINVYIISSNTQASDIVNNWSKDEIEIFCPYPLWIGENVYKFENNDILSNGNKRYPGRYTYRYANGTSNNYIINPHFAESNFEMIIYGPVVNPTVTIGDNTYGIIIVIEEEEYLHINTRKKTIDKIMKNGDIVNAFHNRAKGVPFFTKIQPGRQRITWNGAFNFDIIIYEERSEPKWL